MKHKWKELAQILNCPYRKRFSTNGWGDFRIDDKGLYSYEHKAYTDDDGVLGVYGIGDYLYQFLSGEIVCESEYSLKESVL